MRGITCCRPSRCSRTYFLAVTKFWPGHTSVAKPHTNKLHTSLDRPTHELQESERWMELVHIFMVNFEVGIGPILSWLHWAVLPKYGFITTAVCYHWYMSNLHQNLPTHPLRNIYLHVQWNFVDNFEIRWVRAPLKLWFFKKITFTKHHKVGLVPTSEVTMKICTNFIHLPDYRTWAHLSIDV